MHVQQCVASWHGLADPVWVALQVGFDASGLEGLQMHHIVVNTWEHGVDSEQVQDHDHAWQSSPFPAGQALY